MLLILFNAAISNLVSKLQTIIITISIQPRSQVLFRNDFAPSRDIDGLFRPFQSSSSVLDPASHPSLFQSTLVVIIKVRTFVVCIMVAHVLIYRMSSTRTKLKLWRGISFLLFLSEYSHSFNTSRSALKLQQIVQEDPDANFVTRLHSGKLQIIPWPVIGSKAFYRLFSVVKKKLYQQKTTHRTAGEFLHTLKTLIAKLNVRPIPFSGPPH
jgi:hypothetical protein